jgi:hypothetical protein
VLLSLVALLVIYVALVAANALATSKSSLAPNPLGWDRVHRSKVVSSPKVEVISTEVGDRVGWASVLELSVAVVVHAVVPLADKDTSMILVLDTKAKPVTLIIKCVLDVTPVLGWVATILFEDHTASGEGVTAIVGVENHDDPLDVTLVASVLLKVDVVSNTKLSLTAAAKIPVGWEGVKLGVLAIPVGLRMAVMVQLVDVAVVSVDSIGLLAID